MNQNRCSRSPEYALSPALLLEMSAQATRDADIAAALDTTVRKDISGCNGYGLN